MLPAIMVTGHGDIQMAVEAMKNGAIDFIEKPFSDDVLIDSITRAENYLDSNVNTALVLQQLAVAIER